MLSYECIGTVCSHLNRMEDAMNTNELKEGTRCACRTVHHEPPNGFPSKPCPCDADRVVAVPNRSEDYYARIVADVNQFVPASAYDHIPMCDYCAEYHESAARQAGEE